MRLASAINAILASVIRLPPALERRLQQLFPTTAEREHFAARAIEEALDAEAAPTDAPAAVGGTLHLFTDGGSRGNPGQAAVACIIEDPASGTVLREHYARIGLETNNVAEYRALIEGIKLARPFHPNRLICHLDSELIVRQLNGQYQVKMPSLKAFVEEIRALSADLPDVVFVHIPREDNHRADALVNRALDTLPTPPPPRPGAHPRLPLR